MPLLPSDLSRLRLAHQQISVNHLKNPRDVVRWMGAIQAQDFGMSLWAVGVRLPQAAQSAVLKEIDKGSIIRTHLLRPTWHLVAANDVSWLLDLSAPRIRTLVKSRQRELELTPAVLKKSASVMESVLAGGNHLTREQLMAELQKAKVNTAGQRSAHLLVWSEIEKIICSGRMAGSKHTYALFDERIKNQKKRSHDEALMHLALRYFTSRGPATEQDFANWSGLSRTDVRRSLELSGRKLLRETVDGTEYWLAEAALSQTRHEDEVYLLPAFDEFIIGYKDRSVVLPTRHQAAVISVNGMFWPVIVINGMVTGLWKRSVSPRGVSVELRYFPRVGVARNKALRERVEAAAERVKTFFSKA